MFHIPTYKFFKGLRGLLGWLLGVEYGLGVFKGVWPRGHKGKLSRILFAATRPQH